MEYTLFDVLVHVDTIISIVLSCLSDLRSLFYQVCEQYEFYTNKKTGRIIKFNTLLTTYEVVLKDRSVLSKIKWNYLMVDEAHQLKNNEASLHISVCVCFSTWIVPINSNPIALLFPIAIRCCNFYLYMVYIWLLRMSFFHMNSIPNISC